MRLTSMKTLFLALLFASALFGAATTEAITIRGLRDVDVVIRDPSLLTKFRFGPGPGNTRCTISGCTDLIDGWIAEWAKGSAQEPSKTLPRYMVSFQVARSNAAGRVDRREYVVYFAHDAATDRGYIYLPGPGEPYYQENIFLLARGPNWDGHWFLATDDWTAAAVAAIGQ